MGKQGISKPYLGGWRHKITGVEYLNAASQTGPLRKQMSPKNTCSRMVQCVKTEDGTTQTLCHRATQMWRDDCCIPNHTDKYTTVKPYENYTEMQQRLDLDKYARVIQRYYRAYRLRKRIKELARIYRDMLENCRKREEEKAIINKMRHQRNAFRQAQPRSRADFDMLYDTIEKWRSERFEDIKSRFFKAGQCAESYRVLGETVEMLNQIDKHKQAIRRSYGRRRVLEFLTFNCKPIRWNSYKGIPVEMVTVRTQKARLFKGLYDALSNRDLRLDKRTQLLVALRRSVATHDCKEAFDLFSLLDQKLTLLARGFEDLTLDCLNERIIHTYLNFTSMYGKCGCEAVGGNSRDDELRPPLETKTRFCRSCLKLLPGRRFLPHSRTKRLSVCIGCDSLGRRNIAHVDYDPYTYILNRVRADEIRRHSQSALAFMMQEHDIYHLVNHIWHGQSAVSKVTDLFLLRLARYRRNDEWAPWNCILLTEDEVDVHSRIQDPAAVYSRHLINQIGLAHQIAKNHFKQLIIFERDFRESSRFRAIQGGK